MSAFTHVARRATRRALLMLALLAGALPAQTRRDIIRGYVATDSGDAVRGADVAITRISDRATKSTRSDSAGRFAVEWPDGTGEYVVSVTAVGFQSLARRLVRSASDSILAIDIRLSRATRRLPAVITQAQRPVPDRDPSAFNAGASETTVIPLNAARRLPPDQAGDLSAIAAMLPGIAPTAGGISVLGLAP